MTAGVAQLVRVTVPEPCPLASTFDHLGDIRARHRPTTLGGEHEGGFRLLLAPKLAQGSQFIALDRVNGMNTPFKPPHVQMAFRKVDLIPT